jgi:uncharacterized protein YaaQ
MEKLILAIVSADAVEPVSRGLVEHGFQVTHISSVGGFLRRGSTTLVVGVDETQVEDALHIMRETCTALSKADSHAATIFTLSASGYFQI